MDRLFWKYVIVIVALVGGALLASGFVEIYFSYQENKAALVALQREKALGAASRIDSFIKEIERQIGWTTQPQLVAPSAALEQRRIDYLRLLRQVPAITELSYLDASGQEQLRVSRLAMDVTGSQTDYSQDPRFTVPEIGRIYYGPVYFRKESEPYMTIAMPHERRGGRHGGRGQPQVHLGRGQPDQDRAGREGLRRRRPGRPHRAPRHQPGPPEDDAWGHSIRFARR